jgi:hypothetical protein
MSGTGPARYANHTQDLRADFTPGKRTTVPTDIYRIYVEGELLKTNRSKWFLTGMAALLLSFGLVLSGCPTPVDNNEDGNRGVNDLAIIIEGEAQVGQTLTATLIGGSGAPDILWQWTDDANEEEGWTIRDAKGEEYTLTSAEEGRYVRAYIFIASGNTVEYVYGDFVGPVEAAPVENDDDQGLNDLAINIEGEAQVGRTLTATLIGGSGAPDILWQWTDDVDEEGTPIRDAKGNKYTLTPAEEGRYVRAYINGTSVHSNSIGPVKAAPSGGGSVPGGDNTDNGTPGDGEGIPDDGESTPGDGEGIPDDGESTPGDGESNPDDGESNPGNGEGTPDDDESTPGGNGEGTPGDDGNSNVPPVEDPLIGSVTISGITYYVGETLTADTSALNGSGTFTYKWQRLDDAGYKEDIPGAIFETYTLTQADTAKQIRVEVSCEGYKGERASVPVGPVVFLPLEGSVTIIGTPRVGQTLIALEEIEGNGAITYTWQRSSKSSGRPWTNIISGGEEARTYRLRLVQEDQDKYIRVAVGREGYKDVIYSVVGPPVSPPLEWELGKNAVSYPGAEDIYAAGYGNGKFLVVSPVFETTASSADGATWDINSHPGQKYLVRHIVYGNGMFVAGEDFSRYRDTYAYYSTDNGKTWQTGDVGGIFYVRHYDSIRGMAFGNGTFVAVGGDSYKPSIFSDQARAMYSKDGKKWTRTELGLGNAINRAVAYGGGTFVAMNGEGKSAYSTDGVKWTAATPSPVLDPGDGEIGIAYDADNKRFVAVADNGSAAYSDDNGKTWTTINDKNLKLIKTFSDIDWGGGYFLAGGYSSSDTGKLVYSADGITWYVTGDNIPETKITYSGKMRWVEFIRPNLYVVFGNGRFLVTGDRTVMYSNLVEE